jgi:hypothetical protein
MTTSLDQLPEELLLTIGDHLPNQPLRPCSRGLKSIFELPVDPKWRQYDPQRVCALWKSFLPIGNERCYDLVLLPFEAYCEKHGCKLDAYGTPSIRTLETADSHEETLRCHFDPLDSPGLHPDEVDELWYLQRGLVPPTSRYNYPACWRCGCLVCEHMEE